MTASNNNRTMTLTFEQILALAIRPQKTADHVSTASQQSEFSAHRQKPEFLSARPEGGKK